MVGRPEKIEESGNWLCDSPFDAVILIASNHDILFQKKPEKARKMLSKHDKIITLKIEGKELMAPIFMVSHGSQGSVMDGHSPLL